MGAAIGIRASATGDHLYNRLKVWLGNVFMAGSPSFGWLTNFEAFDLRPFRTSVERSINHFKLSLIEIILFQSATNSRERNQFLIH